MKSKRKEKLLLISPSGHEYQIGFLSPCRDGFVLGTAQLPEVNTSHLTIIRKKGKIAAHITPQKQTTERQYFLPLSTKEIVDRFRSLLENKIVFQLSKKQLSEDVFYLTEEFANWYDKLIKALYQRKARKTEIIHIINFKNLVKELPRLVDALRKSPHSFFGICKAKDLLENDSIVAGFSKSKILIIPIENKLVGIDLEVFTSFNFTPSISQSEISNPINEIYQSMGIPQYFNEIQRSGFLEKLLSKENNMIRTRLEDN